MSQKQLECRICITYRKDKKIELGMYCPRSLRYEYLGLHGPSQRVIDKVVTDLKIRILKEGHLLTFCERSE